jgi:AcrR family transcriptional regulator
VSTLPIWTQPPPGSRKPRFTREQIAATALAIADADGFEALSMRRVAESLGAGTMTLYYYIRTKEDLLALMDDALMAEVVEGSQPLPAHWRAAISVVARATWETFTRHPWALHVMNAHSMVGPNRLRHIEHSLEAVTSLPLAMAAQLELISIVDDFVFGTVLGSQTQISPLDTKSAGVMNKLTKQFLAAGHYPRLTALLGDREPVDRFVELAALMTSEERFERGLAMLLDGFAARHDLEVAAQARPTKPRRR